MSVHCPFGAEFPCNEKVCQLSTRTLCGLEEGIDFCCHLNDTQTCDVCQPVSQKDRESDAA